MLMLVQPLLFISQFALYDERKGKKGWAYRGRNPQRDTVQDVAEMHRYISVALSQHQEADARVLREASSDSLPGAWPTVGDETILIPLCTCFPTSLLIAMIVGV